MILELVPLLLFLVIIFALMLGYPVAFSLGGVAVMFALIGGWTNVFDLSLLQALPSRIFGKYI